MIRSISPFETQNVGQKGRRFKCRETKFRHDYALNSDSKANRREMSDGQIIGGTIFRKPGFSGSLLLPGESRKPGCPGEVVENNRFAREVYAEFGGVEQTWLAIDGIAYGLLSFNRVNAAQNEHAC
jgi:hypothetical protein